MRKLALVCMVLLSVSLAQAGSLVIDNEVPKDIVAEGTNMTLWDNMIIDAPDVTLPVIKTANGVLRLESVNATWGGNVSPFGPFAYVNMTGDFTVEVEVTDYTYLWTTRATLYHNDGGLMIRIPKPDSTQEDNVQNCFFPIWNCGNFLRYNEDGVRTERETPNNGWNAGRFLKMTKIGNAIHVYYSVNGTVWTEFNASPVIRDDMVGIPLQVGVYHATWTNVAGGYIEFDNFKITKVSEGSTSGNLMVKEGNGPADLSVVLDRAPTANVTVTLDPNSNPDIALDATTLTFTPENWNVPQTVKVSAVQDTEIEPIESAIISFVLASGDASFNGGLIFPVEVKVIDDDGANYVFSAEPVTVQEGKSVSYTVSLLTAPSADVIVTPDDPSDPNRLVFEPATLTFTPENALTPQTITVTAVDNDVVGVDPRIIPVAFRAVSADLEYSGLATALVHRVLENDCGAWGFLAVDYNKDCIIDLEDFAQFAAFWLNCTQPNEPGCIDAR